MMKSVWMKTVPAALIIGLFVLAPLATAEEIVHDAEYYILESQNGKKWAAEDKKLDQKLAELKKKHGHTPNIVYILWDDQ